MSLRLAPALDLVPAGLSHRETAATHRRITSQGGREFLSWAAPGTHANKACRIIFPSTVTILWWNWHAFCRNVPVTRQRDTAQGPIPARGVSQALKATKVNQNHEMEDPVSAT